MSLQGQVAVITGASSGIGAAVARNLNEMGMRFVLTGRRAERLDALVNQLENAIAIPGDITDPS